ncbi:hypothetical protein PU02_0773 [Bartonella ancashensis]|uniref:Uncharacterized protein n=1 Tax=Bartonella ancashensis TaxID=1318743 RepID=A0A0M4M3I6_9HYPH|nr:hypothetical protein PU02_0773 [Bartonella ancashensis]
MTMRLGFLKSEFQAKRFSKKILALLIGIINERNFKLK